MKEEEAGKSLFLRYIPGLTGLFVLLFFFSVLDPVSLILVHVSSLLFFFAESRTVGGIGLVGLTGFVYLALRTGELSPDSMAILSSAVLFGLLLRFRRSEMVFYPSLQTGLAVVILGSLFFLVFDRDGLSGWSGEIRTIIEEALETSFVRFQETGAFGLTELVEMKRMLNGVVELMMTLLPSAVCINLILAGVISLKVLRLLQVRLLPLPEPGKLRCFSFSDTFIWGLIAGLLSLVLPLPGAIRAILLNVLALVFMFYLLRGLAVGIFWLKRRGLSSVGIGAAYAFLFALLPPLFIICLFLPGVLDTWFDFRSPREVTNES